MKPTYAMLKSLLKDNNLCSDRSAHISAPTEVVAYGNSPCCSTSPITDSRPTFIDLFAGCGGLSLGLMQAGWDGLFAVEKNADAFQTLKCNLIDKKRATRFIWPDWLPIQSHEIGDFINSYREQLAKLEGTVDLIAGGPPCQGFSFAGKRKADDPRNKMFEHYTEVVMLVKPKFILLENVGGIAVGFTKKKAEGKQDSTQPTSTAFSLQIEKALESDYCIYHPHLIRAADYGVAQLRPRYIMIGIRKSFVDESLDTDPFKALQEHREDFLKSKGLPAEPIALKDAISDLEVHGKKTMECENFPGFQQIIYEGPKTDYQRLLHEDLNGTAPNSLRMANHREETKARFSKILSECRKGVQLSRTDREQLKITKLATVPLHPDRPSHTLTTLPDDFLHYSEPRILTVREYARIQSFPDWFEFEGNYTTGGARRISECPRYTQAGNAVPPFLAEAIGGALLNIYRMFSSEFEETELRTTENVN